MYWQKTREKTTDQIDTEKDKYKNSSNLRLTVNFVSKEDEGEYQVDLARKHNGGDYVMQQQNLFNTNWRYCLYLSHQKENWKKNLTT